MIADEVVIKLGAAGDTIVGLISVAYSGADIPLGSPHPIPALTFVAPTPATACFHRADARPSESSRVNLAPYPIYGPRGKFVTRLA